LDQAKRIKVTVSHGQTFNSPPAKPGDYLVYLALASEFSIHQWQAPMGSDTVWIRSAQQKLSTCFPIICFG
ncbi:hypothetical protein, partial [Nitrosomonas sp. Nm33]|uniref:hypothetical protein n=1 Tax=Nitrosomonas sp. Nm33 TaxID=133724 RepID=UPI00089A1A10